MRMARSSHGSRSRITDRDGDIDTVAARVRERVYVTFAVLAVLLTLNLHPEQLTAGPAALSMTITTGGTVVAAFVAEVIAHLAVHAELARGETLKHMASTSLGTVTVIVIPLLLLGGAGLEWWSVHTALLWGAGVLVASLVVIGWLGLRRTRIAWWQKLLALVMLAGASSLVIAIKLLAH